MKCQYCQKEMKFSHHENKKEIEVYDCWNCPVLTTFYYLGKNPAPIKITFMLDKNEKCYLWTNHYVKNVSYINNLSMCLTKATGFNDDLVIKFPKVMNITPQNVYEKFAFYMVFL